MQRTVGIADGPVGRVADVARAEASARGLDVLEVDVVAKRPPTVTVTVDVAVPSEGRLAAGEGPRDPVDIDVIAELARSLDAALVAGGVVSEDAVLEVSSPGVERPLVSAHDLVRNLGRDVELTLPDERVRGRLVAVEGGEVGIVVGGSEQQFAHGRIESARLVLPW